MKINFLMYIKIMPKPQMLCQQVKIKNNLHLQQQLYLQNYFLKQNNKKITHFLSKYKGKTSKPNDYIHVANIIQNLEDENRLIMQDKRRIYDIKNWHWDEDFENMY
jgi:hypothetical protein